jgi:hypothetical protein
MNGSTTILLGQFCSALDRLYQKQQAELEAAEAAHQEYRRQHRAELKAAREERRKLRQFKEFGLDEEDISRLNMEGVAYWCNLWFSGL